MAGTLAASPSGRSPLVAAPAAEAAARRNLRAQIARLERDIGRALTSVHPPLPVPSGTSSPAGPRVLGLGELERVRDRLAAQLGDARAAAGAQTARQAVARGKLDELLLAPGEHRWARVSAVEVGEPSCKVWQVRPRLGLLGMLMGWWRVKISSGCPLGLAGA